MEAQLIVVFQNGYAESRGPGLRDRKEVIDIEKAADIKNQIWHHLMRINRQGHVVVKWQDKMFVCEMKQDLKGYTRTEVNYHPYQDLFKI